MPRVEDTDVEVFRPGSCVAHRFGWFGNRCVWPKKVIVSFIESIVDLKDKGLQFSILRVKMPNGDWIRSIIEETGRCEKVCMSVLR